MDEKNNRLKELLDRSDKRMEEWLNNGVTNDQAKAEIADRNMERLREMHKQQQTKNHSIYLESETKLELQVDDLKLQLESSNSKAAKCASDLKTERKEMKKLRASMKRSSISAKKNSSGAITDDSEMWRKRFLNQLERQRSADNRNRVLERRVKTEKEEKMKYMEFVVV